ncbi:MAG: isoprenyl transferase [Desulfuromonadaceae bacterium]|nr:isoprenyl transferase [Geobacteraceae bacterium]
MHVEFSMEIPEHIAIIMDGNGRWARQNGLPRFAGHQEGVNTVRRIVRECSRLQIRYLTLYAFSSENWHRPEQEVQALMSLLDTYLASEISLLQQNDIRLNVIGDLTRLPTHLREKVEDKVRQTRGNSSMTLTLALSYGARDEMLRAVRSVCTDAVAGVIDPADLDERMFSTYLDTVAMPDPDILIRTSGEQRISNFLLWQIAYTELFFCPCFWPEFGLDHLDSILKEYQNRCRRFGRVSNETFPQ